MSAHTPGPWTYNQWSDEAIAPKVVVLEDDGACGDPECCGPRSYSIEIKPEDASLIAAAPELLEALETFVEFFAPQYYMNSGGEFQKVRADALAAIAKAKGESA